MNGRTATRQRASNPHIDLGILPAYTKIAIIGDDANGVFNPSVSAAPTVTSGRAAPTHAEPSSSLYMRTDGTVGWYINADGTASGWNLAPFSADDLLLADSDTLTFGDGLDIAMGWDGTRLTVTQAAANSEIRWGIDGAGIDQMWYGDTASAYVQWDQSADSLVLGGVAKIRTQAIAAATGTAIPVTHSGGFAVTTAAAETNTLADPTYLGQTISIFVDTYAVGDRVITAASRLNQAGNTIITLGAVGAFIKLEAITIAGALKWQVVASDGAALS